MATAAPGCTISIELTIRAQRPARLSPGAMSLSGPNLPAMGAPSTLSATRRVRLLKASPNSARANRVV